MNNPLSAEEVLKAAWRRLAPAADTQHFPRGFWPDLARAATEFALAGRTDIELSFRPTLCTSGNWPSSKPRPPQSAGTRRGKISPEQRAANTAALLAAIAKANS